MYENKAVCLCGTIEINVKNIDRCVGVCHCNMCRKFAGGPLFAVDCGQDVKINGQDSLGIYESSEWAQRGFCKNCGSGLFYRLKHNQHYHISAGIFEDQNFKFKEQIFIDEKPEFYDFSNQTKNMTGQEVFEKAKVEEA